MLITDRHFMLPDFDTAIKAAIAGGARLFQLREKQLPEAGVLQLALKAQKICEDFHAHLLINYSIHATQEAKAFGAHVPESRDVKTARNSLGPEYSVGQSVHSMEAAKKAEAAGADYLVFGSVFQTDSHAGSTPAGMEELGEITRGVSIPVFAVGGISAQNARACLDAGAHGVAVIRAVWSTPNIGQAVSDLLKITGS